MISFPAGGLNDVRLVEKAIRKGWIIRESVMESGPNWLADVVEGDYKPTAKLKALRLLNEMVKTNAALGVADDLHDVATGFTVDERRSRLLAIVDSLRERAGLSDGSGANHGPQS